MISWHFPSFTGSLKNMSPSSRPPPPRPPTHSERISMRQSKVDKLYAGLKDLAEERRGKLDERHRLFQLNREVDDLEQWIAEREVVAGSHELGQDYEHVTASTVGRARVAAQRTRAAEGPLRASLRAENAPQTRAKDGRVSFQLDTLVTG